MANGTRHEFSYTHHLALDIALTNRKLDILFDPSEDELFEKALEHASKNGKGDIGKPDIMFRQGNVMVMIEVKHGMDKQVQWDVSTHPCRCEFSTGSNPLTSNVEAVKNCAENGAMHYLLHVLEHKDLLAKKKVKTVLSVGASFDDSGRYTAVPYYGDAETGACCNFGPFSSADYFRADRFRNNVKAARARLEGTEDYSEQIARMREIVAAHVEPGDEVFAMILLWALAAPGFRMQKLSREQPFDDVLDRCMKMISGFGSYPNASYVLQSFKSDGANRRLVPSLDYIRLAERIKEQVRAPPTRFFSIAVESFGLTSAVDRAKIMASCFTDSCVERIADFGSPYGLPGLISANQTGTEENLMLLEDEPLAELRMLAMLNLYGVKQQNLYSSTDWVRKKIPKCVVADLTRADDPLSRVRSIMIKVSQGKLGVFAVDRNAITSDAPKDVNSRKFLNTSYTLKKLIGCKDYVVIAIERSPNAKGTKQTKYVCGQHHPETHIKSIQKGGIKFQSGRLNNGVWIW